jgi:hypothetical protein
MKTPGDVKKIEDFECCPNCESDFGYYQKVFVSGQVRDITLFEREKYSDIRIKYNSEMYDHLKYSRESKFYYCVECNGKICKVIS